MAATDVFALQTSLRRVDRWVHWRAIHHYRCVAVCSHLMAQLHFRQIRQLNLIYLQNCYILHHRGMATARASREAQATRQERTVPTPPVLNPAPAPTVEVAVFSVEPGEENTLAAPKTPPYTATYKKNICDLFLPARCPAVTWISVPNDDPLDNVPPDDVPHTAQFPDEVDECSDHDPDTKTQDWPETNSDSDQPWHPMGPYDPAYDVNSPDWDCDLWYEAREKEDPEFAYDPTIPLDPTVAIPFGKNILNDPRFSRRNDHFTPADTLDDPDFDTKDDYDADSSDDADHDSDHDTKDDGEPDSPPLSPVSSDRRKGNRLRAIYTMIQSKRSGQDIMPDAFLSREFLGNWAAARARCNGTDYGYGDFPDYHFDPEYTTDYNSDLQSPSLTDNEEAEAAYWASIYD